jgi:Uma2 family endonuclease
LNMSTLTSSSPHAVTAPRFDNGEEFLHSIGDVPMSRVIFTPLPGTATEQDLLRFVEKDKRLCELIDGTLVEKPVGFEESQIGMNLGTALSNFVRPRKLGMIAGSDATIRMASGRIRLPDVSYVSYADIPGGIVPRESVPLIPPTIAAEVISETNTRAEMRQKIREYFASGSRLVWLIYPKTKTVSVFDSDSDEPSRILLGNEVLDGGNVLDGFVISLADLFDVYTF